MIIEHLMQHFSKQRWPREGPLAIFGPQRLNEFPDKVKIHILFLNSMLIFQAGMINLYAMLAMQSQFKNLTLKMYCN
jgi:hypothetical protein